MLINRYRLSGNILIAMVKQQGNPFDDLMEWNECWEKSNQNSSLVDKQKSMILNHFDPLQTRAPFATSNSLCAHSSIAHSMNAQRARVHQASEYSSSAQLAMNFSTTASAYSVNMNSALHGTSSANLTDPAKLSIAANPAVHGKNDTQADAAGNNNALPVLQLKKVVVEKPQVDTFEEGYIYVRDSWKMQFTQDWKLNYLVLFKHRAIRLYRGKEEYTDYPLGCNIKKQISLDASHRCTLIKSKCYDHVGTLFYFSLVLQESTVQTFIAKFGAPKESDIRKCRSAIMKMGRRVLHSNQPTTF